MLKRSLFALFAFLFIGAGVALAADGDLSVGDFFASIMKYAGEFKDLALKYKIAGALTIILSTIKVSFLREKLWDKWGSAKVLVAPIVGVIIGILMMEHITFKGILDYMVSIGGGAIVLHQLLDALKSKLVKYQWAQSLIGFIQGVLPGGLLAPEVEKK